MNQASWYSRWVIAAFALALAIRLAYVLTLSSPQSPADLTFDDERVYVTVAQNFAAGVGFVQEPGVREASKAPAYPLILAACNPNGDFAAFVRAVRVVQAIIGAGACVLVWLLCRRIFGDRAALAGAIIAAIYPFAVFYCGTLLSETLFITLFLGAILFLDMMDEEGVGDRATPLRRRRLAAAIAAGLLLGLATLTRPTSLYLLPFYFPFWLIKRLPTRTPPAGEGETARAPILPALGFFAIAVAAFCVMMTPWVTRNYRLFHAFVPGTLQSGESLYEGNSPYATGGPGWGRVPWEKESESRMMDELQNDRFWHKKAVDWIRSHPGEFVRLAFVKFARTWSPIPNYEGARAPFYIVVSLASYVPVMLFGLIGLIISLRRWRRWLLLVVPAVYYSAVHSVTVGSIRYREPAMPFIMIFAGFAAAMLLDRVFGSKAKLPDAGDSTR